MTNLWINDFGQSFLITAWSWFENVDSHLFSPVFESACIIKNKFESSGILSVKSLMKIMKSKGPQIETCGTQDLVKDESLSNIQGNRV